MVAILAGGAPRGRKAVPGTFTTFTGTNDLVVADVMLGPLVDNGGPTWTHLAEAGSPSIDSGDDAMCPGTDQRGYRRPQDGDGDGQVHCDRGASFLF